MNIVHSVCPLILFMKYIKFELCSAPRSFAEMLAHFSLLWHVHLSPKAEDILIILYYTTCAKIYEYRKL
jgi:hypothetical protein